MARTALVGLMPSASLPSFGRLHGFPNGPQQEFRVLHFVFITIEGSRGGPGQDLSIEGEGRGMAGTEKLIFLFVPVIGASQMRALGRESDEVLIGGLDAPGRALL